MSVVAKLSVDKLSSVLRENGLNEGIIKAFRDAGIDREQFFTLTREEFCDQFKILKDKRAAIAVWSKVTGLEFDGAGKPVSQITARTQQISKHNRKRSCIESDSDTEDTEGNLLSHGHDDDDNDYFTVPPPLSPPQSFTVSPPKLPSAIVTKPPSPTMSPQMFSTPRSLMLSPSPKLSSAIPTDDISDLSFQASPLPSLSDTRSPQMVTQKDWVRKYTLPTRFSCPVEAGLKAEYLTTNLINEMVRDICTSVLNYTSHPKKMERETVAKLIVEKYPFPKDPLINKDTTPWGSYEMKIQNRFKKLQRKKSMGSAFNDHASKPSRPKKMKKFCWDMVPEQIESEEDVALLMTDIRKAWNTGKRNHGKISGMMSRTYAKRRELVLIQVKPILEIIKSDFENVMGNTDLSSDIKNGFKIWMERLLTYGKTQPKFEQTMKKLEQAVDSGCPEEECKLRTSLRLIEGIFKKSKKSDESEGCVVKIVEGEQSVDAAIEKQIQPVILLEKDLHHSDLVYVVAEGIILCNIPTKN